MVDFYVKLCLFDAFVCEFLLNHSRNNPHKIRKCWILFSSVRNQLDIRTYISDDDKDMSGNEFLRKLRKYAKANGLLVVVDQKRGKGSHVTVYVNGRFTMLKDRTKDVNFGLLSTMLRQLNIDPNDF